jgi:hypothetical protein
MHWRSDTYLIIHHHSAALAAVIAIDINSESAIILDHSQYGTNASIPVGSMQHRKSDRNYLPGKVHFVPTGRHILSRPPTVVGLSPTMSRLGLWQTSTSFLFYFLIVCLVGVTVDVGAAFEIANVTQTFQPSGRFSDSNSL